MSDLICLQIQLGHSDDFCRKRGNDKVKMLAGYGTVYGRGKGHGVDGHGTFGQFRDRYRS